MRPLGAVFFALLFWSVPAFAGPCDSADDAAKFLADCQKAGKDPTTCVADLAKLCGGPKKIWCVPESGSAQPGFRVGCVIKCTNGELIEPTVCLGDSTDKHDPTERIEIGIRDSEKHNYKKMLDVAEGKISANDAGCTGCHFKGFGGDVDHGTGKDTIVELTPGGDGKKVFLDAAACKELQGKFDAECKGKSPVTNMCSDLSALLGMCAGMKK